MFIATVLAVFVIGYLLIALEHNLHINKAAPALLTGVILWTLTAVGGDHGGVNEHLSHHVADIAPLLFFLLGAMTIVELVDAHEGFSLVTRVVRSDNPVKLMWIIGLVTFFLSAVLDNLTTTIVMLSLVRRLVPAGEGRWPFAGIIIIAANAGGAWSPIGDLTTTMLWLGGHITTGGIISQLFLPSLVCLLVPLVVMTPTIRKVALLKAGEDKHEKRPVPVWERNLVFGLGVGALLFVPVFKTLTGLPPYIGILLGLSVLWLTTEILHRHKPLEEKHAMSVVGVLTRIDTASVLFFLGILLAVASLGTLGLLEQLAAMLGSWFTSVYELTFAIGVLSAIIDNVPLVAAAMKMYPLATEAGLYSIDGKFWELLALAAGVGGSCLIIGSAAGVAAMGIEKIPFGWYLKKVGWAALLGLTASMATYALLN